MVLLRERNPPWELTKGLVNVRFGSKADIEARPFDVYLPPKADIAGRQSDVRFVPKPDSYTAAIPADSRNLHHTLLSFHHCCRAS
jgi:hypothetical protein